LGKSIGGGCEIVQGNLGNSIGTSKGKFSNVPHADGQIEGFLDGSDTNLDDFSLSNHREINSGRFVAILEKVAFDLKGVVGRELTTIKRSDCESRIAMSTHLFPATRPSGEYQIIFLSKITAINASLSHLLPEKRIFVHLKPSPAFGTRLVAPYLPGAIWFIVWSTRKYFTHLSLTPLCMMFDPVLELV
jgi:hypothetical protein